MEGEERGGRGGEVLSGLLGWIMSCSFIIHVASSHLPHLPFLPFPSLPFPSPFRHNAVGLLLVADCFSAFFPSHPCDSLIFLPLFVLFIDRIPAACLLICLFVCSLFSIVPLGYLLFCFSCYLVVTA